MDYLDIFIYAMSFLTTDFDPVVNDHYPELLKVDSVDNDDKFLRMKNPNIKFFGNF